MIANNITLSPATDNKLRIRAFFDKHSREPRGETERYWQRQLTELDAELHLRFNLETQRYIILYDHHGLVTVVWSFAPDESFGLAMMNLRHKTTLNARKLRDMLKAEREGQEAAVDDTIADASEQAHKDVDMMCKSRTTTDSVDQYKTPAKYKLPATWEG